ncbi:amidohydrolase family protein [Algisphaera agarilytica]|uniref:Cytosine/adenosine deaminase-related metal-dependent hydrolase n=1 Tax=Algisphaera agarilytica TaxID=1385975 RepID=A0A7X0LN09_9BACT|nr:amidohydrolase family protein [Algisphaera agarilytica]MBB6431553.1 cytosine/adenosine deaminase-related metal-dependent hydrolase [Algisphaera agarilytica]
MNRSEPEPSGSPFEDVTLIRAGAIAGFDASATIVSTIPEAFPEAHRRAANARPAAILVSAGRVAIAGEPNVICGFAGDRPPRVIDLPDRLVMPGFINVHAHLELTSIGPQPYGGDFVGWVAMLREHWPGEGEAFAKSPDPEWFAAAAALGAEQSRAAGVQAIGDITRFDAVAEARRAGGLDGVSFIELFGMGTPWDAEALARLGEPADGFQPHAPYSAGPALFDAACASGRPVSCHLAETHDERRFIAEGDGPFLDLLQSLGKWSPDFASRYGDGLSPVRWMEPYLRRAPWLLAHCNYVSDDDIALLAETGASVAYCPIASEYFGHDNHRYREMLDAGVNVCLGTDSIVCQPANEPQPLGILPQMRRLYQRDQTDPALLLRMATAHGRQALQLDGKLTCLATAPFDPDDETDALTQVLQRQDPVQALALNEFSS